MKYLVLVLLMVGFVSAVGVDFDCPNSVFVDEEFECRLEVLDGSGVYDVKVEFDTERDSVLKIWNEKNGKWLSGYYYLTGFVDDRDSVDVKLKVSEIGKYDGVLKLRQGEKREFFEVERIIVKEKVVDGDGEITNEKIVLGNKTNEMIALNEKIIYESRDSKVVDKLVYGFAIFLIFVIGILVWGK
ncbi:MAG: hypothetical protein V1889_01180 [archaeon]